MYDNDYIVMIDENGQPYIAHAFGDRARAVWGSISGRAVKYRDKIRTKSGKWRYIYDEAVGNNAKRGYQASQKNYWASKNANGGKGEGSKTRALREAADKSKARYEKTLRGRIEKLGKSARTGLRRAQITLKKHGRDTLRSIKNAPNSIKDKLGYDEKEAYERTLMQYRLAGRRGTPQNEQQREAKYQLGRTLERNKEAYDNTVVGKLDKLQDRVEDLTHRRRRRKGKR